MDSDSDAILKAVANVLERRLKGVGLRDVTLSAKDVPAPVVYNEVRVPEVRVENAVAAPVVNVYVDMAPVAAALDRMSSMLERALDAEAESTELLSQLVRVLADQPAPVHSPEIHVPAPRVHVEAPAVSVDVLPQAQLPMRTLRIKHSDGTTSTVEEA